MKSVAHVMAPYDEATAKPHHGMIPNLVSTAVTAVIPQIVARTRTTKSVPVRRSRTHAAGVTSFLTTHVCVTIATIAAETTSIPRALKPMETTGLKVVT
jgi:4-hydroxyphenylpyruvate dioxygenase-like putative hemolysin